MTLTGGGRAGRGGEVTLGSWLGAARRAKNRSGLATTEYETVRKKEEGRFTLGPSTRVAASAIGGARSPWFFPAVALAFLGSTVVYEARTSALQSWLLSRFAARISYKLGRGPSPAIVFPRRGPSDQRSGYARLPDFLKRLQTQGFGVAEQARFSPGLTRLTQMGIPPPYPESLSPGLRILGADGEPLFETVPRQTLRRYEDVPPVIVQALLFIENRELQSAPDPRSNPAVEWDRLARGGLTYIASRLGLPVRVQGGSTLATQIVKYRHSDGGRTHSALDKLRQMVAASLRAYRDGADTRGQRKEIVLEYLNTMPLAASPDYGEIAGFGDGLWRWFGMDLAEFRRALEGSDRQARARAFKDGLALLCAVRAPTRYLLYDRNRLEKRVGAYTRLLAKVGVLEDGFARDVEKEKLEFHPGGVSRQGTLPVSEGRRKAVAAARGELSQRIGVSESYELDRLDLEARSTIDAQLQDAVGSLFKSLQQRPFLEANGLYGKHLLSRGNPKDVLYSLMLYERSPEGNRIRVQADNLDHPLDLNTGIKLELGSTAKLRAAAHYLEIVAGLHSDLAGLSASALERRSLEASDPITRWACETLRSRPQLSLEKFLEASLDRKYSASPWEAFFTGGGIHTFQNFDPDDNGRILTVREGLRRSVNLVFIRLMRDLVRFHEARLPYDVGAVLSGAAPEKRRQILEGVVHEETRTRLDRAYERFRGASEKDVLVNLLGRRAGSARDGAIVFLAWKRGLASEDALARWLSGNVGPVTPDVVRRLLRAYSNPRLTLSDFAYLLRLHPLDIWAAGELARQPDLPRAALVARSDGTARLASEWLFEGRNRKAQDLRLKIRFEQDAFAEITRSWRRLGFPFERLVPSYATAIGSSGDRPSALAELVGIISNGGVCLPTRHFDRIRFAAATPYETELEPALADGGQVMDPAVARVLRGALREVVRSGTAARAEGAFRAADGTVVPVGGKTGSGDNRFSTFAHGGRPLSRRAVNRTATFAFYIGDRYFGVITAFVPGRESDRYSFTSALPVAVLRLLAPAINTRLAAVPPAAISPPVLAQAAAVVPSIPIERGRLLSSDLPAIPVRASSREPDSPSRDLYQD